MSLNCSRKALCDAFTWKSGKKHLSAHQLIRSLGTKMQRNKEFNSYHLKHFQLIRWKIQTSACSITSMLSKCAVPKMVESPNIAKRPKSVINKYNCLHAIQMYRIRFECEHTFVHLSWHRLLWKEKSNRKTSKQKLKIRIKMSWFGEQTWTTSAYRIRIERSVEPSGSKASQIDDIYAKRRKKFEYRIKLFNHSFACQSTYFSFAYVLNPSPSSSTKFVENATNFSKWYPVNIFWLTFLKSPFIVMSVIDL